jgi:hypothetical protein
MTNNNQTNVLTQEVREHWENVRRVALEKMNAARTKETVRKWNREAQVAEMMLRTL